MSKGKILVVDDEEIVRISCKRLLTPEGYDVRVVRSAVDAFSLLRDEPFDLVLTDLKMPDIDGIEVLRRVKEEWPEIAVVMITGYQTITTAVQAIKLGAFDYLEKPFTPDSLLATVGNALRQKQAGGQSLESL